MVGAVSQYLGAAVAVNLFPVLAPAGAALLRVAGAAAAMSAVMALRRRYRSQRLRRADQAWACAFGVTLAGMNTAFYFSMAEMPLGNAVAVEFLGPLSVVAAGARTVRSAGALALAAAGVVVLAGVEASGTLRGVGFALLAGFFWAGYIVLGHRVARSPAATHGLGIGLLAGTLAISPIGIGDVIPVLDSPKVLALGLGLGVLSNAIPYTVDQQVMQRISHARFALLQALLPVTAALAGFALLFQVPSPRELLGIGLVVGAIAMGRDRRSA